LLEFAPSAARAASRAPGQLAAPAEPVDPVPDFVEAPWMATAIGETGVAEYRGMHSANPRIMEYFKASGYWGEDDTGPKNAWCGSFIAWVMRRNNIPPVRNAYRATAWSGFGKKIVAPVYGAIGIKARKGGGHVAFVMGQSPDGQHYCLQGGNQNDKVQILQYPKGVWTTFVVPHDYDLTRARLPVYDGMAARAGSES